MIIPLLLRANLDSFNSSEHKTRRAINQYYFWCDIPSLRMVYQPCHTSIIHSCINTTWPFSESEIHYVTAYPLITHILLVQALTTMVV